MWCACVTGNVCVRDRKRDRQTDRRRGSGVENYTLELYYCPDDTNIIEMAKQRTTRKITIKICRQTPPRHTVHEQPYMHRTALLQHVFHACHQYKNVLQCHNSEVVMGGRGRQAMTMATVTVKRERERERERRERERENGNCHC